MIENYNTNKRSKSLIAMFLGFNEHEEFYNKLHNLQHDIEVKRNKLIVNTLYINSYTIPMLLKYIEINAKIKEFS